MDLRNILQVDIYIELCVIVIFVSQDVMYWEFHTLLPNTRI